MLKKVCDFIIRQFRVNSFADVCLLILKLMIVVFIAGELYGDLLCLGCLIAEDAAVIVPGFILKRAVVILICYILFVSAKNAFRKKQWKNFVITLLCFQFVSTSVPMMVRSNFGVLQTGLLGIFYWNGPYWGRVTDADTGEPVAGVAVSGRWEFWHFILISDMNSYADAREAVTDADGRFFLPPGRETCLWPFTTIGLAEFRVFKPGYRRIGKKRPENIFKPVSIKLKKVRTKKERRESMEREDDRLFDIGFCEEYKIERIIKMFEDEEKFLSR